MSIVDKIRNIFVAKKNIKNTLIEHGSDINNDTVLADYPDKIDELRCSTNVMNDIELEFAKFYFDNYFRNKAFWRSTLKTIDLSNMYLFSNKDEQDMFYEYDLSHYFYQSEAETIILPANQRFCGTMMSTFEGCSNLKTIENIETLDPRWIKSLKWCFKDCTSLEYLDLSSWDFRYDVNRVWLYDVQEMFANCTNLKYLDVSKFELTYALHIPEYAEISQLKDMFTNCRSLEVLKLEQCAAETFEYIVECLYLNGTPDNPYLGPCKIYYDPNNYYNYHVPEALREIYPFYEFLPIS